MAKPITELLKDKEFIFKLVDFLCGVMGFYYLIDNGCLKVDWENAVAFAAFSGTSICCAIIMYSHYSEEKNASYEKWLLAIYALINMISAYIFYSKIDFSCGCTPPNSNFVACFIAAAVASVSMVVDLSMEKEGGGGEGGDGGEA